jgi:hypothetical protein
MATVTFTAQQFNYVMSILNDRVQAEGTANPANSGDLANTPTFKQGDVTVAQAALAAMQNAVS